METAFKNVLELWSASATAAVNNVLKGSCNYGYVPPPTPY
jgi:hypothetical protein